MAIYGEGRLLREFDGKKSVLWFCIEHEADGRYRIAVRSLDRRPGRAQLSAGRLPIEATPHAYERFIQAMQRFDSDRFMWRCQGFVKIWLESGLAFVEIPERGAAVLRTIVDADALIGPNRTLWETLGSSEQKIRFVEREAFEYRDPFTAQSWLEPPGEPT